MSDPPPFPIRLSIVALKATALWVNTMLTFFQDEFPHPEEVEQDEEEQAQEQEQEHQDLLGEQQQQQLQKDQSAVANISARENHFTEENYRRQLLSMLTSQVAIEPAAAAASSLSLSTEEPVRDQMDNNEDEDVVEVDDSNHNHNHQPGPLNDTVDHTQHTDEETVVNEVLGIITRTRRNEATVAGAIEILLALNRRGELVQQNSQVGNDELDELANQDKQNGQDEQNGQSDLSEYNEQNERNEQDGAQKAYVPSPTITRRLTRGAVAMRNRMELESLQGAMDSAAAAEALEASRARSRDSDEANGALDTDAQGARPSVVIPRAFTFKHVSKPDCPNGDIVYRFTDGKEPHRQLSWVWSEYSRSFNGETFISSKMCMGVNQCPKCGYAEKPRLSHRKKLVNQAPYAPFTPNTACQRDGTPLIYVGCSARFKILERKDLVEITHSGVHNHGKPQLGMGMKRTYDEMEEGIVYEDQSAVQGSAHSAVGQSNQPRRSVIVESNNLAVSRSPQSQPSVMIDNKRLRRRAFDRASYGVHVDRVLDLGRSTSCSVCNKTIARRTLRVLQKVRTPGTSYFRQKYYHPTCLSALSKDERTRVQELLKRFGDD